MIRLLFLWALFLQGGVTQEKNCSPIDVFNYLNLTNAKKSQGLLRPVRDWKTPTQVHTNIFLIAITGMIWQNEFISWNPDRFCGIKDISIPKSMVWTPDLFVMEKIADSAQTHDSRYVLILHNGTVVLHDDFKGTVTCKVDMYKFPFDTQSCSLTFISAIHTKEELELVQHFSSAFLTQQSKRVMHFQGDWEFLNISITISTLKLIDKHWDQLLLVINMQRKPLLHIINFLVPILFFLTLDIASFFISDTRGEKLGFKVNVLLTNSIWLLILNAILPSTSNNTPLIATYCTVVFAFMVLSLVETIGVTYLIERDSSPQAADATTEPYEKTAHAGCQLTECVTKREGSIRVYDISMEAGCESVPAIEPSLTQPTKDDLQETRAACTMKQQQPKSQYWEKMAKRIDAVFLCFYITGVSLFLYFLFSKWTT